MRDTVTIFVPSGYANSTEFLDDCGFESLSVGPEDAAAFNDGYAAGLEDSEDKVTAGEVRCAIEGTKYSKFRNSVLRERVALEIWHRFSDSHVEDWEDEPHKQEYYFCADAIIRRVWEKLANPTSEMLSAAYDQQAIIPEDSWPAMLRVAMERKP